MYVLIANGGQWEDSWEQVIAVSHDREKLIARQEFLSSDYDTKAMLAKVLENHLEQWEETHPWTQENSATWYKAQQDAKFSFLPEGIEPITFFEEEYSSGNKPHYRIDEVEEIQ